MYNNLIRRFTEATFSSLTSAQTVLKQGRWVSLPRSVWHAATQSIGSLFSANLNAPKPKTFIAQLSDAKTTNDVTEIFSNIPVVDLFPEPASCCDCWRSSCQKNEENPFLFAIKDDALKAGARELLAKYAIQHVNSALAYGDLIENWQVSCIPFSLIDSWRGASRFLEREIKGHPSLCSFIVQSMDKATLWADSHAATGLVWGQLLRQDPLLFEETVFPYFNKIRNEGIEPEISRVRTTHQAHPLVLDRLTSDKLKETRTSFSLKVLSHASIARISHDYPPIFVQITSQTTDSGLEQRWRAKKYGALASEIKIEKNKIRQQRPPVSTPRAEPK